MTDGQRNQSENAEKNPYPFNDALIQGAVFAEYSKMGPESLFTYPIANDCEIQGFESHYHRFTGQNFMQVAIKSISLLMTDYSFEKESADLFSSVHIFGVLPYPDMGVIGFTYFTYFYSEAVQHYIPVTLTLLVDERHRSFIYDYINRLKDSIKEFTKNLFQFCAANNIHSEGEAQEYWQEYLPKFLEFFSKIQKIQEKPISPITQKRRIKILFTGLESTGKTSFLLTIKREFSALPSLLPTTEPIKNTLDFLGTTILKLDVPGNASFREEVLKHADVYIYETDVIYFFINLQEPRIEESKDFLE
ncbi:MAG: hypothetical protein KAR20_21005, partial [Candidatus Heimdallarchaeota archaeon]|nr:hypothetical protein [Candidatus Heimdallarchaeota archaeon]